MMEVPETMKLFIILSSLLLLEIFAKVDAVPSSTSCCQNGVQYFKSYQKNTNDIRMCYSSANQHGSGDKNKVGAVCKTLTRICCINRQQQQSCEEGVNSAHTYSSESCGKSSSDIPFAATALKCCECCQLGKQKAESEPQGKCKQNTVTDTRCNAVFERCCEKAKKDILKPKTCAELSCQHDCKITKNGPECVCRKGFQINPKNITMCLDIDECKSGKVKCYAGHRCHNLPGSYLCRKHYKVIKCPDGYEQVLDICRDIDECKKGTHNCKNGSECQNILRGFQCVTKQQKQCSKGFYRQQDRCIDINECKTNPCKRNVEKCQNTVGSYQCLSVTGNGADCPKGYRSVNSGCRDINECIEDKNICQGVGERCINVLGTYQCACKYGYRQDPISKQCEDIDECSEKLRRCSQKCYNTIGSFQCACNSGFSLYKNKISCMDVDECKSNKDICNSNQQCVNTRGSFVCLSTGCPRNYQAKGSGACMRACTYGEDCADLPILIKTFIRSRRKSSPLRLPIGINLRNIADATGVDFKFVKGNEKGLFSTRKIGPSRILVVSTKPNFNKMDPFAVTLKLLGIVNRPVKKSVTFEYHLILNFY